MGKIRADFTEGRVLFNCLFRFGPVFSDSQIYGEGASRKGVFHSVPHDGGKRLHFVLRSFENEFVVNLHDHPAFEFGIPDFLVHGDHRPLDDVCRGSLYRHVGRLALGTLSDILVGVVKAFDEAFPSERGFHVSAFAGFFKQGVVIRPDTRVTREERVDVSRGFRRRGSQGLRESETGYAVNDSKIDGFGDTPLFLGYGGRFRKEELRGFRMDVPAAFECGKKRLVSRKVRENPKFDLRIVRYQVSPRIVFRSETGFDGVWVAFSRRNVLKVGGFARKASGGGSDLVVSSMDPSVFPSFFGETFGIGRTQLFAGPVFEDEVRDGVVLSDFFKRVGVDGKPGLDLLSGGDSELFEQDVLDLFGGIGVERLANQIKHFEFERFGTFFQCLGDVGETFAGNEYPHGFHSRENRNERRFEFDDIGICRRNDGLVVFEILIREIRPLESFRRRIVGCGIFVGSFGVVAEIRDFLFRIGKRERGFEILECGHVRRIGTGFCPLCGTKGESQTEMPLRMRFAGV